MTILYKVKEFKFLNQPPVHTIEFCFIESMPVESFCYFINFIQSSCTETDIVETGMRINTHSS